MAMTPGHEYIERCPRCGEIVVIAFDPSADDFDQESGEKFDQHREVCAATGRIREATAHVTELFKDANERLKEL